MFAIVQLYQDEIGNITWTTLVSLQVRLDLSINYNGMPQTPTPSEHGEEGAEDQEAEMKEEAGGQMEGEKESSRVQTPKEGKYEYKCHLGIKNIQTKWYFVVGGGDLRFSNFNAK